MHITFLHFGLILMCGNHMDVIMYICERDDRTCEGEMVTRDAKTHMTGSLAMDTRYI